MAREIPRHRLLTDGLLGRIARGEVVADDLNMFSELKGKTFFVVGHVELIDGRPSFEVRRPGQQSRYIPINVIKTASIEIGFNFVSLGCETGETLAVGTATKISDVDGLKAFQRAISEEGRVEYLSLLASMSDPNLRFVLDPLKSEKYDVYDVEIVDASGKTYFPGGAPVIAPRPAGGGSAGGQFPWVMGSAALPIPMCAVDENVLNRSYSVNYYAWEARRLWPSIAWALAAFVGIVGAAEIVIATVMTERRKSVPWQRTEQNDQVVDPVKNLWGTILGLVLIVGVYGYLAVPFGSAMLDVWNNALIGYKLGWMSVVSGLAYFFVGAYGEKAGLKLEAVRVALGCTMALPVVIGILSQPDEVLPLVFIVVAILLYLLAPLSVWRWTTSHGLPWTRRLAVALGLLMALPVLFNLSVDVQRENCRIVQPMPFDAGTL
ncbi:hypothetical protein HFN01_19380 [Rhizobium leguminosarum]|uniref:hypothetical protein n=1 Tax=Rhizobium leguminosarum TaxID=384 RepID=UPI001C981C58|nr:hypothetical protein [Rhizobium leguminosarum]MBY5396974.1 hypothetical protein [Rhizobium leguminosarum]